MLVKVVENGCPICGGEVRGNSRQQYFCKECNMLFRSYALNKEGNIKEVITDNKAVQKRMKKKD